MGGFFTRERFGEPQIIAGLLLLAFLAQCIWLASRTVKSAGQGDRELFFRLQEGLRQWHGEKIAGTSYWLASGRSDSMSYFPMVVDESRYRSPLYYLIASAPLAVSGNPLTPESQRSWEWLARVPYLLLGVLLGASLWYVSRRLYGNAGGYIALTLYCFAPGMIRSATLWHAEPEMGAAWGAFGSVFTAIAVAHTLYAPREVVLWNWRRILLLGLSLALAIGCQFSLAVMAAIALGFMMYLAPTRKRAALAIWIAACVIGGFLILACYGFRLRLFLQALRDVSMLGVTLKAFGMFNAYRQVASSLGQASPALAVALPVALVIYLLWPRARYFGNSAPLLVSAICVVLAVGSPHFPGLGLKFVAVPFLFVFVAGILTDLLETKWRNMVMACIWGLLGGCGLVNLIQLARLS